jgi:ribonuclease HI
VEDKNQLPEVIIYTDGACIDNPGPGGYGIVLKFGSYIKELSGGFRLPTNNRMEMMAAIVALGALKKKCAVTLYSDSQLLVDSIDKGWVYRWRKKGWKQGRKWRRNADLWERLLALYDEHEVKFTWVRGHAGLVENEKADQLSMAAAWGRGLAVDQAYEAGETQIKPAAFARPDIYIGPEGEIKRALAIRQPYTWLLITIRESG